MVAEAQALGQRRQAVANTAVQRSQRRYQFRQEHAFFNSKHRNKENKQPNQKNYLGHF
jgi:hypothetical protein